MTRPVFKTTKRATLPTQTIDLPSGEPIFSEGEIGTEMYIVREGSVEIVKRLGDEEKQLAVMEKGDFFGEMALLEDLPRNASARALTDVKLLEINGSTFDQMLRTNPEIAVRMMRKLSRRLRETDRLLQEAIGRPGSTGLLEVPSADLTAVREPGPQRLVHDRSGMEFFLSSGPETLIGRRDPVTGIHPDVDLAPVDSQRSISRRHAKLHKRQGKFFLAEEIGTMNGTFVNGDRLETGMPVPVQAGDELRFGLVVLRFVAE